MECNWLDLIRASPRYLPKLSFQTEILYSDIAENPQATYWSAKPFDGGSRVTGKHTESALGCSTVVWACTPGLGWLGSRTSSSIYYLYNLGELSVPQFSHLYDGVNKNTCPDKVLVRKK